MVARSIRLTVPAAAFAAGLALAACGQVSQIGSDPFVTETDQKLPEYSRRDYVSLCYNADTTTRDALTKLAAENCEQPGSQVSYFTHDMIFNNCPVTAKARVTFLCELPPAAKRSPALP